MLFFLNIGNHEWITTVQNILHNINTQWAQLQNPPTPHNIQINKSKSWNNTMYLPPPTHLQIPPPLLDYHINLLYNFLPYCNYYTNGLFKPPKEPKEPLMEDVKERLLNMEYLFQIKILMSRKSFLDFKIS